MSVFAMVVWVVAISVIGGAVMQWLKTKEKIAEAQSGEQGNISESRVGALEERIQVLEKIVTDKGFNLAREIDGL